MKVVMYSCYFSDEDEKCECGNVYEDLNMGYERPLENSYNKLKSSNNSWMFTVYVIVAL